MGSYVFIEDGCDTAKSKSVPSAIMRETLIRELLSYGLLAAVARRLNRHARVVTILDPART